MKTLHDLRAHLFGALEGLSDKAQPLEIDRARAIADMAQTIINTAKVELDYMRQTGGGSSEFVPLAGNAGDEERHQTATGTLTRQGGRTVHRIR